MMDWIPDDPTFLPHDWENFGYDEEGQIATVVRKLKKDETPLVEILRTNDGWKEYLSSAIGLQSSDQERAGIQLLLCSRAPEVFKGDPSPPSYLPFSQLTWQRVAKSWHVHRGITRVMSRRVSCFSATKHINKNTEQLEVSYLARMSAGLPGDDLALSTTFIPATKSQFCVIYGCNESQIRKIKRRIATATDELHHPLTVVGLFAELERERLVNRVDDLVDSFTLRSEILEKKYWNTGLHIDSPKSRENIALCLQSRDMVDQIRSVKRQLVKFMSQVDTLNKWMKTKDTKETTSKSEDQGNLKLREIGEKIQARLQDIIYEYDDKIDECKMMSESLSLAMQTIWNQIAQKDSKTNTHIAQVNTMIAMETKSESVQMKSIALLTMIFLPLSCVASVFSTSLFNFPSDDHRIVSKYIWVFFVSAFILTLITVVIWHYATNYEKEKEKRCNSFKLMEGDRLV